VATEARLGAALRHWPEYAMEAALLGTFMVAACGVTTLLEHPHSPIRQALPDPLARRALIGMAMGATAVGLIHSPFGQRSGAHFNPSVTLTFLRLGKIRPRDAAAYVAAQFVGGVLGVLFAAGVLGMRLADERVRYAATAPGPAGVAVAFAAEAAISFGLMLSVLLLSNHPRYAGLTGVAAGSLVALYITVEAPLSGMSMNPARSFASAVPAGAWSALWVYFTAPPLGMLAAAELYLRTHGAAAVLCAKLHHRNSRRCIFCESRSSR